MAQELKIAVNGEAPDTRVVIVATKGFGRASGQVTIQVDRQGSYQVCHIGFAEAKALAEGLLAAVKYSA